MKKQVLKILMLGVLLIFACMLPVNASDANVRLNASKTELYAGETFTVMLNAQCADGINGLSTVVSYDTTNLELVSSEIVDTTKWFNLGENLSFDIIHYASGTETSADLLKLTFKVKATATESTTAKITASNVKLDSDASSNSMTEIGIKEVEISILEKLNVNIADFEQIEEGTNKYIHKINPKTLIENLKQKIQTNGIIKIFKDNVEVLATNIKLATGMEIRISLNNENLTYKTVVKGDTDGDGEATFTDILQINKHRLNKASLTNEYLKAADVTGEGSVDFRDILKVNKYRLGIDSL